LDKEGIEDFAIKAIKEILSDHRLLDRIEKQLESIVQGQPQDLKRKHELLQAKALENEQKIKNLTRALERGVCSESVCDRLKEVESEQVSLREELQTTEASGERFDVSKIALEVKKFVDNFEKNFPKAPIEERKLLVKKMISEVVVDRETNTVRFYLRRLPAITPLLEEVYKNKTLPTKEIVSSASSGGGT
jgi:hypothetical protein